MDYTYTKDKMAFDRGWAKNEKDILMSRQK